MLSLFLSDPAEALRFGVGDHATFGASANQEYTALF